MMGGQRAVSVPLAVIGDIIDASGAAGVIEDLLPHGARGRQLTARTLLTGMMLTVADGRPAHLTRVHAALTSLPETNQARLGITTGWTTGPHQLTYRQVEHPCRLITRALAKDEPDGAPAQALQAACDSLLEASILAPRKNASSALAADWTDAETWSRPPRRGTTACADPEAAWGHRNSNLPGPKGEMFFGCFLSAAVMAAEEDGSAAELARRMDPHQLPPRPRPRPGSGAPAPSWSKTCTRTTLAAPVRLTAITRQQHPCATLRQPDTPQPARPRGHKHPQRPHSRTRQATNKITSAQTQECQCQM
jgi:hypothetical protein